MQPEENTKNRDEAFLKAVYELTGGEAGVAISLSDLAEYLGCSEAEVRSCSDHWTKLHALEWPALHHVALTREGAGMVADLPEEETKEEPPRSLQDPHSNAKTPSAPCWSRPVSVIIPVLNEAATIGNLVRLVRQSSRVREVIVVDDGSIDDTMEIAAQAGAAVMMSSLLGKGASMEDGLGVARGEVLLFLDGDLRHLRPDIVEIMTDPILDGEADLVKANFTRDAGRVTVLTARPLLSKFFPELAEFKQPLGGIVAARRALLQGMRFENDYGVDVGILIDATLKGAKVREVDIGYIAHDSQPLEALAEMAQQVTRVILDRAWRYGRLAINHLREMEETERRARASVLRLPHTPAEETKYALLDMDGVLVDGRYVVELAKRTGTDEKLAPFLDNRAIPEHERARLIAATFTNVPREVFEEVARSAPLMEGAAETVVALRKAGYRVGIVTDSYHIAAEIIRRRVFADFSIAHLMRFRNGVATGELTFHPAMINPQGCKRHYCCKANVLRYLNVTVGVLPERTVAVGDGVNDACLLREVGMSVAFRPKDELVERSAQFTVFGRLREILGVLGLESAWSEPLLRESQTVEKT